jgi:putative MATE family efflux protein
MALPSVATLALGVAVSIAETGYIGRLGTVPLAAMALVFPFGMLVQMLSSGAMGGGVSSAISRALGANDRDRAEALALHACVIGLIGGLSHMLVMLALGPALYSLLGGRDEVLTEAVGYGWVLFAGAPLVWLMNAQLSIVRGTGNMVLPARLSVVTSLVQIVVGATLGLGLGPFPLWGLGGVACGTLAGYGAGALWLVQRLTSGDERLRLRFTGTRLQWPLFADILKVGAVACLSPTQAIVTMLVCTALIAPFGTQVLAGYGIGQRLEFLLIPISFGIGVAAVPMVGMAIGAGLIDRARRVAWTAASISLVNLSVIGLLVAAFPWVWTDMFSNDPEVLAAAATQLRWVGPAFGMFGFGLTLYFAAQGSGRIAGPVIAASVRLALVIAVGWLLNRMQAPLWTYFALVACGMCVYAMGCALSVKLTRWR